MSDYSQTNLTPESAVIGHNAPKADQAHLDNSQELALTIAQAAEDRKAGDITILKVAAVSYLADYFVLVTGYSKVQVRAIALAIAEKVEQQLQLRPLRVEGQAEGTWVLQDYGDVLVHIMMPKEREYYNLEAFWSQAERIEIPASSESRS